MWSGNRNEIQQWRRRGESMNPLGGFMPTDIAGLQLWLDFSDITTLFLDAAKTMPVTADGDVIGAVEDKSGNGNDATQATTANKPLHKTAIQNSLSIGRFDGVNDILVTPSITHGVGVGEFYLLFVIRLQASQGAGGEAIWGNIADNPIVETRRGAVNKYSYFRGGYKDFDTALSLSTPYVLEYFRESGTVKGSVNGVEEVTTHVDAFNMANAVSALASGNSVPDDIGKLDHGEMTFYNLLPTVTERESLRAYANGKWAIF